MTNVTNDLENITGINGELWWTHGVQVRIVLKRRSAFYTVIFVLPVILITSIALMGMFTPSSKSHERGEKCSMGLTSLLTIAVILLMVADMVPRADTKEFPILGRVNFQLELWWLKANSASMRSC